MLYWRRPVNWPVVVVALLGILVRLRFANGMRAVTPNWCCRQNLSAGSLRRVNDPRQYPYGQQQVIYQSVIKQPSNGMAVTALVLGIVAIVFGIWIPIPIFGLFMMFVAFLPAVLAAVFGHVGLNNSATSGVGRGGAITGLVLGYLVIALSIVTTALWFVAAASSSSTDAIGA